MKLSKFLLLITTIFTLFSLLSQNSFSQIEIPTKLSKFQNDEYGIEFEFPSNFQEKLKQKFNHKKSQDSIKLRQYMLLILIICGLLVKVIFSSNIYAQKDLNFQYGNFPNNLAETVEKASENRNSPEMKLLECVTYSNSAPLGESREMYKQAWSKIQPIIESEEFSMYTKITIIAVEWNAIDTMYSPIPYVIDLCAKSYDETGKFLQEIDQLERLSKP